MLPLLFIQFIILFILIFLFFATCLSGFDTMLLCSCTTCIPDWDVTSSIHFKALASILPAIFPIHDAVFCLACLFFLTSFAFFQVHLHITLDWALYSCTCSVWLSATVLSGIPEFTHSYPNIYLRIFLLG